ncbi:transposase [Streptomyces sp. NPDC021093]|uniref:transposase n=1 Tax=Streptomyces sp. NPDC021093 TaxID=3365112 RepID=UPI0037A1B125
MSRADALHPGEHQRQGPDFPPRAHYEARQRIHAQPVTDAWKQRYARCSGVEGAVAQASRRSDIHHARYRGLDRARLQRVLTALAISIVRIDSWLKGQESAGSWTTRLTRLHRSLAPPLCEGAGSVPTGEPQCANRQRSGSR